MILHCVLGNGILTVSTVSELLGLDEGGGKASNTNDKGKQREKIQVRPAHCVQIRKMWYKSPAQRRCSSGVE